MPKIITPTQAALMLNTNPKQVRRYIKSGRLKAKKTQYGHEIDEREVNLFTLAMEARKKLGIFAEETYVLKRHNAPFKVYSEPSALIPAALDLALLRYEEERNSYFNSLNIQDASQFLLGKEVAARLRIRDYHVIDRLIKENFIRAEQIKFKNRTKFIIFDDSFKEYLGNDIHNRFYTSQDAANATGHSVRSIDRIALDNYRGRKIVGTKNSHYLFNENDINFFCEHNSN